MCKSSEIKSIESEAGVIATLIHHPEFCFHSEDLLPSYFTDQDNMCLYIAICDLAKKGIKTADTYNIIEDLTSNDILRKYSNNLSTEKVQELVDVSDVLARQTIEEYQLLAKNVINTAFRRTAYEKLKECEDYCFDDTVDNIEKTIYANIDDVMLKFASTTETPQFKDVVDDLWNEVIEHQDGNGSGIPFKINKLNEYVTIEPGELIIFAAEQKAGKSMFLLNEAVDMLKMGKSILYIDSELNSRLFLCRLISHLTKIEFSRIRSGRYNDEEADEIGKAIAWIKEQKFTHVYVPMFDKQTIYTMVKKITHTQGIDCLVIDYFKSTGDGDAYANYQELGRLVDMIKNDIAGAMDICALGAAQLTSSGKLADSAKIARNASTIIKILDKTPEEIDMDGAECGNKKMFVQFNRNGMQHMDGEYIDLQFNGNVISFEEAKQHEPHEPY